MSLPFLPGFGSADDLEIRQISPISLAYLGDAIFEMYVRDRLVGEMTVSGAELHRQAVIRVQAGAQARALRLCLDQLTVQESDVVRRARNVRCGSGRQIAPADYHYSTAFEALLGYLYLLGNASRLAELMAAAFAAAAEPEE